MIFLKRSQKALIPGGICVGMIASSDDKLSWPDPRWLHPFNLKQIETLIQYSGLDPVKIEDWGDLMLFHTLKV